MNTNTNGEDKNSSRFPASADAALCAKMFLAGARKLEADKEWINELNVFPVPDGDTGTNMTLTIMSAVKEISALDTLTMASFSKAVSSGSLRGARGNSGVILSQLLRGFTKVVRSEEVITPVVLTSALQKAVETAYKAVMKPKEGTILTVARGGAERAAELLEENPDIELDTLMAEVIQRSEEVLNQTPELLPVLKEAGVVDSGGQGLLQILKGAYDAYRGIEAATDGDAQGLISEDGASVPGASTETEGMQKTASGAENGTESSGTCGQQFPYCTEFILHPVEVLTDDASFALKTYFEAIGDSVSLAAESGQIHVHLHTNEPGHALSRALKLGALTGIQIVNLPKEHKNCSSHAVNEKAVSSEQTDPDPFALPDLPKLTDWKETGFISVSIGDGIADIFRDLGVDCLIEGGQTMNPSTEDMLNAISQVNAKNIFILPNNKNIILAANQAKELTEDKNIFVIPTRTVPQGITAVINYVPEKTPEENAIVMEQEIECVRTGQITYAVRDTHIENKVITAGDIMGVGDHSILAVGKDIDSVAEETIAQMITEESELISIYYGEDMKESEASVFCDRIAGLYPDIDVELNHGGQPIYYYIISVE